MQKIIWVWWSVKKIASGRCKLSLGLIAGDVWRGGLLIINEQIISVAYNFYESITQAWVLCTYVNHPFWRLETVFVIKISAQSDKAWESRTLDSFTNGVVAIYIYIEELYVEIFLCGDFFM
jgi:hypothetical protein